jgi:cation transport protein ChaC
MLSCFSMSDFWVFGYGSLMWRPDFPFEESRGALLRGAHRALCVYSWHHRGTKDRPGLVLGLDRGGSCRGIAFRVAGAHRDQVMAQLRERELITDIYREVLRPVVLLPERTTVAAVAFVINRASRQYAGALSRADLLAHVMGNAGRSGRNEAYVVSTAQRLASLGIRDPTLEWLAAEIRRNAVASASGG